MPWDRWEEQSVYFCEVVCRDVLLPAVASHTTAASSTPRDLRLQSSAVPARIRRSDEMPHGSAAPRCAHDASLLVTSLKPRVAGGWPRPFCRRSKLPRWPADEEELELSGDRERRGEKLGERKLEMTKR